MRRMPQLNLFRRHTKKCPNRNKGRRYTKCTCPIWYDGDRDGKEWRGSLRLRDWQRAVQRLARLEDPDAPPTKAVAAAIEAWKAQLDVQEPSRIKYSRLMHQLRRFCEKNGIETMDELGLEQLDTFRASRKVERTTAAKELQTLRQFLGFCFERRWAPENYARKIKMPKPQPNEVVPYTPQQVTAMLVACEVIGHGSYERLRARALVLLLRYTGLRIMDAITLATDRVKPDGRRG